MAVAVALLTVSALLQEIMGDHAVASLIVSFIWVLSMSLRLYGTGDGPGDRVRMRSHGMWTTVTTVDDGNPLCATAYDGEAFGRWRFLYLLMGAMILFNAFVSLVDAPGGSIGVALVFLPVFLYTAVSCRTGDPSDMGGDIVEVRVTDRGTAVYIWSVCAECGGARPRLCRRITTSLRKRRTGCPGTAAARGTTRPCRRPSSCTGSGAPRS